MTEEAVGFTGVVALVLFAIQNGSSAVVTAYIMQRLPYVSPKSWMMVQEGAVKLPLSVALYVRECGGVRSASREFVAASIREPWSWALLCVPSLLWTVGAVVQGVGMAHLDAPIAQLVFQAKIPFTAAVSMVVLGTRFTRLQWLSIGTLCLGIVMVGDLSLMRRSLESMLLSWSGPPAAAPALAASPGGHEQRHAKHTPPAAGAERAAHVHHHHDLHYAPGSASAAASVGRLLAESAVTPPRERSTAIGVVAFLAASALSALASVFLERMLKQRAAARDGKAPPSQPESLWLRNIQLSFPSTCIAAAIVFLDPSLRSDPLLNITPYVYVLGPLYAGSGGLLVALILRYASSVLRGFSAAASTIIATVLSAAFMDFHPSPTFCLGAVVVIGSTYVYSRDMILQQTATAAPPPTALADGDARGAEGQAAADSEEAATDEVCPANEQVGASERAPLYPCASGGGPSALNLGP